MGGRTGKVIGIVALVAASGITGGLLAHWHDAAENARLAQRIEQLEAELRVARERTAQLERRSGARPKDVGPSPHGRAARSSTTARDGAGDSPGPDDDPDALAHPLEVPPTPPGAPDWNEQWIAAWQRDALRYGAADMAEIEDLYREGGTAFDTEEGRETLARLVEQFPGSNRAGCSAMNLGGAYLEEGDLDQAQFWLEEVIGSNSDALFGSGEAVLPKALFHYGALWQQRGDEPRAREAWERLLDEFADERDEQGTPYGELASKLLGS